MIGRTISHYRILEELGRGGMGVVYKAHDTKLDRVVALKFLPHHLTANDAEKARFLQEAKAVATLNHPNVCTIYRIDDHEGQQFIEMEYVDGQTLRRKVPVAKIEQAMTYVIQIGEALQEAHSKGIVHRDIKCENIMVNSKNQIKVMDFGLAKLKGSLKLTRTSSTVGTLAYMAPEQIQGGDVDARSDIFSFGIVLFELVTGKTPFRGEHEAAMMYSILNEEPESLLKYNNDLSPELDRIIKRSLEKDPEDRYQHVDDMVSELRREQKKSTRVVRPSVTDARPESPAVAKQTGQPPPHRKKRIMLIGAVATLLTMAATLLYLFNTRQQSIDSLAVLPFANVTTDPNSEYLTEGITENITNKLSQLSKLRVIPRSMVAKYKGKDVDPREVGKDLNVSAVLTGKVFQRGDALSIQTELIDIRNVSQLWGEQYNKTLTDIISIQQDIAEKVTEKLKTQVSGEERKHLSEQHTSNAEAYQLYLKGRYYWNKRTDEGALRAMQYFKEAIDIDPNFALAYSGIADSYITYSLVSSKPKEYMPLLKAAALKALELDDGLAEAHASLAIHKAYFEFDFAGAERDLRRAITLNPRYATAHHWLAELLIWLGQFDEGLAMYDEATKLDPLSLAIASDVGAGYFYARQYDHSIEQLKKVIEMDPNFVRSHFYIMSPYLKKGMPDIAFQSMVSGMTVRGDSASIIEEVKRAFRQSGFKGVARMELDRGKGFGDAQSVFNAAKSYLDIGDEEQTLNFLEWSYEERQYFVVTLNVDPAWDSIRDEPRFIALMKKLGFE